MENFAFFNHLKFYYRYRKNVLVKIGQIFWLNVTPFVYVLASMYLLKL